MRLRAGPEDAGARLDAFLAGPLGSRARAQKLIEDGGVRVDGAVVPKRHRVAAGGAPGGGGGEPCRGGVPADPGAAAGDPAPAPFAVRYEDDDLLVVEKPAGVVV